MEGTDRFDFDCSEQMKHAAFSKETKQVPHPASFN